MNRDGLRQIANVLAALVTIAINALANILPFNGLNTGAISDRFKVFFVPAGYVFSIWSIIYIGVVAFAIYQALPRNRANPRLRKIGYWFVLSCIANSVWMFLWHYLQFVPTLLLMIALLVSLVMVYQGLGIGRTRVPAAERWCVHVPFSVYLGWITVATIANVTNVLNYLGWSGGGIDPAIWAVIMLAVAVVVALAMAITRRDVAYLLVLVWAFAGIGVKQADTAVVATSAWIASAIVAAMAVWALVAKRSGPLPAANPAA